MGLVPGPGDHSGSTSIIFVNLEPYHPSEAEVPLEQLLFEDPPSVVDDTGTRQWQLGAVDWPFC